MTEAEARKATKYFAEGVRAEVSACLAPVSWRITVERHGAIEWWSSIDTLLRSLQTVRVWIERKPIEIWGEGEWYRGREVVTFADREELAAAVGEIQKAVLYVQGYGDCPLWEPVSADIWEDLSKGRIPRGGGARPTACAASGP